MRIVRQLRIGRRLLPELVPVDDVLGPLVGRPLLEGNLRILESELSLPPVCLLLDLSPDLPRDLGAGRTA